MLTKQNLEDLEQKLLAPYATLSKNSQGREYPEPVSPNRTEFERDRDRVIHSKAFRRLIHKTQVFIKPEKEHFRNRLTHTLEVAQIARHIARVLRLNEDLAETIALAHDLGHTPFGHAGELILNELMQKYGGFEHNRQSKKIVEKLEKKYVGFDGLNLTYETRDGLIKHRTSFDNSGVKTEHGPTLEAQATNIADEIAYNSHDTDDALMAGVISHKDLYTNVSIWKDLSDEHEKQYPGLSERELQNTNIRKLINLQVTDLVTQSEMNLVKANIKNYNDVLAFKKDILDFSPEIKKKMQELQKFLIKYFYESPKIIKRNEEASDIIHTLFKYYVKHPQEAKDSSMFTKEASVTEAVCDYIAGMTDDFARRSYQRLK